MVKIPPSKFLLIQIKIEDWPTILRFSRAGGIEATLSFPRRIREIEVIEGTNGPTAWTEVAKARASKEAAVEAARDTSVPIGSNAGRRLSITARSTAVCPIAPRERA